MRLPECGNYFNLVVAIGMNQEQYHAWCLLYTQLLMSIYFEVKVRFYFQDSGMAFNGTATHSLIFFSYCPQFLKKLCWSDSTSYTQYLHVI